MLIPSIKQWKNWSLPSKLTFVGTLVGTLSLLISVYPYVTSLLDSTQENVPHEPEAITIPLTIRNELPFEAHINPALEFYIIKPQSPGMDITVESGTVRLNEPAYITKVNGNYPIPIRDEIHSAFTLPKSNSLSNLLDSGGYKLRIAVTNTWVWHYSEIKDVLFDYKTIESGVRLSMFQESAP